MLSKVVGEVKCLLYPVPLSSSVSLVLGEVCAQPNTRPFKTTVVEGLRESLPASSRWEEEQFNSWPTNIVVEGKLYHYHQVRWEGCPVLSSADTAWWERWITVAYFTWLGR